MEMGAYCEHVTGSEFGGGYPGDAERKLRATFERATELSRDGPCVLLIDEVDVLCPQKGVRACVLAVRACRRPSSVHHVPVERASTRKHEHSLTCANNHDTSTCACILQARAARARRSGGWWRRCRRCSTSCPPGKTSWSSARRVDRAP